jgi:pimeloyl-ACP methyl ester carboxylesterase
MTPIEHRVSLDDTFVTYYEWGTTQAGRPSVIFFHATGFHARCWDEVIRQVGDIHAFAVDAVGHGRSGKPAPPRSWQRYGQDVITLARQLNLSGAIAVGHSMGGNMITRAAAELPDAFSALLLVDPVILPLEQYTEASYHAADHPILRRRSQWDSPAAMVARFKDREPFSRWHPHVLRDYAEHGLICEGEGCTLACDPWVEAHIYASTRLAINADIYDVIPRVHTPVRILRSDMGLATSTENLSLSPTAPDVAARFVTARDVSFAQYTHLIAMEAPDVIALHLNDMLEGIRP